MPSFTGNQDLNNQRDKLSSGPVTPGNFGNSTSSNLTNDMEGAYDNHYDLFPHNNINSSNKKAELAYNFFKNSR